MNIDPIFDPSQHFIASKKVLDFTSIIPTSTGGRWMLVPLFLAFMIVIGLFTHSMKRKETASSIVSVGLMAFLFSVMVLMAHMNIDPQRAPMFGDADKTDTPFVSIEHESAETGPQFNQDKSTTAVTDAIAKTYGLDVLRYDELNFDDDDHRNISGHVLVSKKNAPATSCDITTVTKNQKAETLLLCAGTEPAHTH